MHIVSLLYQHTGMCVRVQTKFWSELLSCTHFQARTPVYKNATSDVIDDLCEKRRRWGEGPSNEMNMYKVGFKVLTFIQPCILTELLSHRHRRDIIRCLDDAQSPGDITSKTPVHTCTEPQHPFFMTILTLFICVAPSLLTAALPLLSNLYCTLLFLYALHSES